MIHTSMVHAAIVEIRGFLMWYKIQGSQAEITVLVKPNARISINLQNYTAGPILAVRECLHKFL